MVIGTELAIPMPLTPEMALADSLKTLEIHRQFERMLISGYSLPSNLAPPCCYLGLHIAGTAACF